MSVNNSPSQSTDSTATATQAPQSRHAQRFNDWIASIKSYFNLTNDLLPQADAEAEIRAGVSFKGSQLLILIFAIFVASLGLNTDSVPVIIGAMLISPLMGPIIGMGLGIGIHDYTLLTRSVRNIGMAMIGSILASALYFLVSPQFEGGSQLLARTSPSIYDVLIALFGGAAGIVSIACKNKGQVMPGVAIATSLMPPLCTVGYGLATWQATYFFGALYLFCTNMVFILFATWIGVKLLHYKTIDVPNTKRARRVQSLVYTIVVAMIALSCYLTFQMIRKNNFLNAADRFVANEMVFPNTQVLSHKALYSHGRGTIDVTLIGQALPKDSLQLAMMQKLDSVGLAGTQLNIRQGFAMSSGEAIAEDHDDSQLYLMMQQSIMSRDHAIDSLKSIINTQLDLTRQAEHLAPELRVLFPTIDDVALARTVVADVKGPGEGVDTINLIMLKTSKQLAGKEIERIEEFIKLRINSQKISILQNPPAFPWKVAEK
ncbi:MAG: TIGR00341 family protein [Muribaculaceae bacterium]|nr:TIGR00341 family protein [Muribaculaceae bacterium]